MMTVINTNTAAINAQYNLSKVQSAMDDAMSALSSGKRINSAADDAAGLSIITRMESQVRGLSQAMKNAADGQNMIATAEGAMDEMTNMLQRMRELAIQASNDTMSDTDRKNLNAEVDQLISEIDRVVDTTRYNDIKLLDGSFSGSFQIGAKSGENMSISVGNLSSTALGTTMVGVANSASVSNSAVGEEAVTTISQLAFNGNDTYSFDLIVGDDADSNETMSIANGVVSAGNADDIKSKIQAAIDAKVASGDLSLGGVTVQVNSNVITLNNTAGAKIKIDNFTSTGNGSAQFTSISGTGDNVLLGGAGAAVLTASNTGGTTVTAASDTLSLQQGKDYSFRLNGELIEIENFDKTGGTSAETVRDLMKLAIGANEDVSVAAPAGDDVTFTIANTDGSEIRLTNFVADSSPEGSKGEMSLVHRVDVNGSGSDNTFAQGNGDWSFLDGKDIAQLNFSDTSANYKFDLAGVEFTVKTKKDDGSIVSLAEALITTKEAINTKATTNDGNALYGKVEARITDGKLEIENLQSQLTGPKGTITFAITDGDDTNTIDDASTTNTLNDDLDYNILRNNDSAVMTFTEGSADYSFTLTGVLGSGALGGDITVNIKGASENRTLDEALDIAVAEINENDNLTATRSGAGELTIQYVNYEGNPSIKNSLGQDLAASTTINSGATASLAMNFTEAYADYSFTVGGETVEVTTSSGNGVSIDEAVAQAATDINALVTAGTLSGLTATATGSQLIIEETGAADVVITALKSKAGPVRIDNFSSTGNPHVNAIKIDDYTSTGRPAVVAGDVSTGSGVDVKAVGDLTVSGTEAVAAETYIRFVGDDEYSFTLDGNGSASSAVITASIENGSLSGMVNAINAQSDTTKVTASASDGVLKLTRADGGTIELSAFDSTGSGTAQVSHAAGQGDTKTLNDDVSDATATTAGAGLATATTMELSMSATDDVSFKISDGKAIATVRLSEFSTTNNAEIVDEIAKALSEAGSDIKVSVEDVDSDGVGYGFGATPGAHDADDAAGKVILTNANGGKIEITQFTSDGTNTMTASPGTGQGVAKILDDTGLSGSGSALSSVNLASQEGADDALAIIDAAMENINSTRSELGAMSNRLDHTINNLGNVVVNTEAAQSRIEDADFATETSNLTKAQILSQAATAMLAQANASKQSVLSLLQG